MYADKVQRPLSETSDRYNVSENIVTIQKTQLLDGMPQIGDAHRQRETSYPFLAYHSNSNTTIAPLSVATQTGLNNPNSDTGSLKQRHSDTFSTIGTSAPQLVSQESQQLLSIHRQGASQPCLVRCDNNRGLSKTSLPINRKDLPGIGSDTANVKLEGLSFGSLGTTGTYRSNKLSISDEDEKRYAIEEGEISCHSRETSEEEELNSLPKDILTPSTVAGSPTDMQYLAKTAFFKYADLDSKGCNSGGGDIHSGGPLKFDSASQCTAHEVPRYLGEYKLDHLEANPNAVHQASMMRRSNKIQFSSATSNDKIGPNEIALIENRSPCIPQLVQTDYSIDEKSARFGDNSGQHISESKPGLYKNVSDNSSMTSRNHNSSSCQPMDLRRDCCDQNLFVFHLPSEWREEDLRQAFSQFGTILSTKVVKRPDGSSKGYGFVCFKDRECAVYALEKMNGFVVGGKRLKVSLKKTPEECLKLQVQKLMKMSQQNCVFDRDRDCSLFVFHLPPEWEDADLRDAFLTFGSVVAAKVSRKEDGTSRGYGFVTCSDPKSAALAIMNLNGMQVANKRLKVQPKQLGAHSHPKPDCTVFIFHLPNDWTDNELRQIFSHSGRVVTATVQRDSRGRSRGFGFVTFDKAHSARDAVADLNGFSIGVKRLKVSLKKSVSNNNDQGDGFSRSVLGEDDLEASDFYGKCENSVDLAQLHKSESANANFESDEDITTGTTTNNTLRTATAICTCCTETGQLTNHTLPSDGHHSSRLIDGAWGGKPAKVTDIAEGTAEGVQSLNSSHMDILGTGSQYIGVTSSAGNHHFMAANTSGSAPAVLPLDYRMVYPAQKLVGNTPDNNGSSQPRITFHRQNIVSDQPSAAVAAAQPSAFSGNNVPSGQALVFDQSTAALRLLQQSLINQSTAALFTGTSSPTAARHLPAVLAAAMTQATHPNALAALSDVSAPNNTQPPTMVRYQQQRHQQHGTPATTWAHIPYATTHPSLAAIAASIPVRSNSGGGSGGAYTKMGATQNMLHQRNSQQHSSAFGMSPHANGEKYTMAQHQPAIHERVNSSNRDRPLRTHLAPAAEQQNPVPSSYEES